MMMLLPTINKAYAILMERESQRKITKIGSGEVTILLGSERETTIYNATIATRS